MRLDVPDRHGPGMDHNDLLVEALDSGLPLTIRYGPTVPFRSRNTATPMASATPFTFLRV